MCIRDRNIRDLYREQKEYLEKEVMIGGWLRSKRDSKSFGFLVINDGTFFEPLQVVYSDQLSNFEAISKLNVGAALIVKGVVTPTPQMCIRDRIYVAAMCQPAGNADRRQYLLPRKRYHGCKNEHSFL